MKTPLMALFLAGALGVAPTRDHRHPLIQGVWMQESSQAVDHQAKIGDHGKARGPLQIHYECWVDAKMPDGRYEDVETLEYAARVFWRYTDRWAGKKASDHDRALAFHWGPSWAKHSEDYWREVHSKMPK